MSLQLMRSPNSNPHNEHPSLHQTLLRLVQTRQSLAIGAVVGYTLNMKLSVTLDRDEDGIWIAECPAIPGCVSQGKTKPQALKNIKEAIALCLEVRAERGLPLTVETQQVEVLV
jgi:predicted RNase H-like HicB family nuclease